MAGSAEHARSKIADGVAIIGLIKRRRDISDELCAVIDVLV